MNPFHPQVISLPLILCEALNLSVQAPEDNYKPKSSVSLLEESSHQLEAPQHPTSSSTLAFDISFHFHVFIFHLMSFDVNFCCLKQGRQWVEKTHIVDHETVSFLLKLQVTLQYTKKGNEMYLEMGALSVIVNKHVKIKTCLTDYFTLWLYA